MSKTIRVTKGSKLEGTDGKIFDIFGFQCIEYRHHLDQLTITLLARESGVEYIKMGVTRVYNAPVYMVFNLLEWDGSTVDAGRLRIRLKKISRYNKAWGIAFNHCQMTVDPVGGQAMDILRRDQLVHMLKMPSKV